MKKKDVKNNFLKNSKGISPVVATVLLIAMVVVISLIIFMWFRGFTQEAVTKFDTNVELVCNDIRFEASYSGGLLSIVNTGNIPIYKMNLKILEAGSFITQEIAKGDGWPELGLNQGAAFSQNINFAGKEEIVLIPILIGQTRDGKKSFTCSEQQTGFPIKL